jgi:hypothetical protein
MNSVELKRRICEEERKEKKNKSGDAKQQELSPLNFYSASVTENKQGKRGCKGSPWGSSEVKARQGARRCYGDNAPLAVRRQHRHYPSYDFGQLDVVGGSKVRGF